MLSNANIPTGTTASVTGFSIAGTTQIYPPGSNVTLTDPLTGEPIGTLVMSATGAYTFDPVPGYVGPTPGINVYSKDTNGQTAVSSLTIDVAARKDCMRPPMGKMHLLFSTCACSAAYPNVAVTPSGLSR